MEPIGSTRFLSSVFLLVAIHNVSAQDLKTKTLKWNAVNLTETSTVKSTPNPGSIVTFEMNRVEIRDQVGAAQKIYALSNPVGDLSNAAQNGRVRYTALAPDGQRGIFIIDRRDGETRIYISFLTPGSKPNEFQYNISSVEIL